MIIELLEVSDSGEYAVPHPSTMGVIEFKRIVRRDRGSPGDSEGRKKIGAAAELAYVFHMADPSSPYAQYEETYRSERIIEDFLPEGWMPDDVIEEAIDKYKELKFTPAQRLLEGAIVGVHKLIDFFNEVDLGETDTKGKPIFKSSDLMNPLKDIGKVVDSLNELEKKVAAEKSTSEVNRGDVRTNRYSEA